MSSLQHSRHFIFHTHSSFLQYLPHKVFHLILCRVFVYFFYFATLLWCELLLAECALIYSLVFKFNWCGFYGPIDRTVKQTLWTLIWFVRSFVCLSSPKCAFRRKFHQNVMISIKCYQNFGFFEIETEIVTVMKSLHKISINQKKRKTKLNTRQVNIHETHVHTLFNGIENEIHCPEIPWITHNIHTKICFLSVSPVER